MTVLTSPAKMTGLTNGVPYSCNLPAYNGVANGEASPSETATPSLVETTPGPPRGVTVRAEASFCVIDWEPPLVDGGIPVEEYTITCGSLVAGEWVGGICGAAGWHDMSTWKTSHRRTGLAAGVDFRGYGQDMLLAH